MKTLSFFATATVLFLFLSLCLLFGVSACKDSCDSIEITIDFSQDSICLGNSITLSASEDGDYLWSNGEITKQISVTPTETTNYQITLTSEEGCTVSASKVISVGTFEVTIDILQDSICLGNTITLSASKDGDYLWSNGATTKQISVTPTETTTYQVSVTSQEGCIASASQIISVIDVVSGNGAPSIIFTSVPPYGSNANLIGIAKHIQTQYYKVAVYIKANGGWWTKPYFASPLTVIQCYDGRWVCDITTGGNDVSATEIAAFLIPSTYTPPNANGIGTLPTALFDNAVAYVDTIRIP